MRITQRSVALTSLQGLNGNLAGVAKLQQQLTSGRLVSAPSDSPTAANLVMQVRSEQAGVAQQARNIGDAQSWMGQTDSALQTMLDSTRRVRDLTVQGMSTGSMTTEGQQALAAEVRSLREGLISLSNLSTQGRPLFGGVTSGSQAYDATGAWVGQGGAPVTRRISDTESIRVDITGPEVFGPPGNDLFAVVDNIAVDLVADPVALSGHLADLDVVMDGMLAGLADVGARASRLDRMAQINVDRGITLATHRAQNEDIDLPYTIMQMQMQQTGYEAALAATAKAMQPTLLDFLR